MKKNVAEFLEFRFEKLKLLKQSDRGEVWLASCKQSGEFVIIKRVALTGLPYDMLKNFSFKLPAKLLFCAEDESETVVVEEFINGENLLQRLEQRNFLSESEARDILLQMCDGLKELHEQKIIHRDIKPSNMILQGKRIRLIDFDAARIFKDDKDADTKLLGTRGYAPPEQFGSGQTDPRSDIYALGVTIRNLLGGKCGGLKKILDRCTELDPKNRFQNVDELKRALTAQRLPVTKIFVAVIFVAAVGFFSFESSSTVNRAETSPDEKISAPQKVSTPAQSEPTKFPEIVLPSIAPNASKIPEPQKFSEPTKKPEPATPTTTPTTPATFKLPEIVTPPVSTPTESPPPINIPPPAPQENYSGLIKTEFYINGVLYNQHEHRDELAQISRDEWRQTHVRLHITNDTGRVWPSPTIKFILGENWGNKFTDKQTLPDLAVGQSADFEIPFSLFKVSDKPKTKAYIQIYLEGAESKLEEYYWAKWFDLTN